jgi:hypothetical protein
LNCIRMLGILNFFDTKDVKKYGYKILNVLTAQMGNVDDFYRLFLVPGIGTGCSTIDWLTALEDWMEDGIAPDSIIGTRAINTSMGWTTAITRPVCLYLKTST